LWIVGLLSLPTAVIWKQKGLEFFRRDHAVPGWAIAVGVSIGLLTLVLFVLLVVERRQAAKQKSGRKTVSFKSGPFEWLLTSEFCENYDSVPASNISENFMQSMVLGPLCPECKLDAYSSLRSGDQCLGCGWRFHCWDATKDPCPSDEDFETLLHALRTCVYEKAQAAARRGELKIVH